MKVLIADKLADFTVTQLEALGCTVTVNPDLSAEDLPAAIGDAEVLVVRSTKVKSATIGAASNLSLIIRAGAGVNTIDLEAANERGIHVANCPGKNTAAVAELAIGLMIAADRRIADANFDLRNGEWKKKIYSKARGLNNRTLGVIGLGAIGKAVVKRAQGLNMQVIGYSRSLTPETAAELGIGYCSTPLEVAKAADVISLHIAAKPETKKMVNADFFAAMKEKAILINTSRGEIVDTEALKEAILSRGIRAGLDVYENEPAGGIAEFADTQIADMAVCTPHIGASTDEASDAVASEVVRIVKSFIETGKPLNVVNIRSKSEAVINLVVRHFNKVGVLAGVLDELRAAGINIEEMENTIFEGGKAATCALKLDSTPDQSVIDKISNSEHIINASLK